MAEEPGNGQSTYQPIPIHTLALVEPKLDELLWRLELVRLRHLQALEGKSRITHLSLSKRQVGKHRIGTPRRLWRKGKVFDCDISCAIRP
jgi:hypothetical protein